MRKIQAAILCISLISALIFPAGAEAMKKSCSEHNFIKAEALAPDCTNPGMCEHLICTLCGLHFENGADKFSSDGKTADSFIIAPDADAHDFNIEKSEENLTRPVKQKGVWTDGYYTFTCRNNPAHIKKEPVKRADYKEYLSMQRAANSLLYTDIKEETKDRISDALYDNIIPYNLIASEQGIVDAAADGIRKSFEDNGNKPLVFTVIFKSEGKIIDTREVIRGNNAVLPPDPANRYDEKIHYIFIGWDCDTENINSDLTVNAVYEQAEHKYSSEITLPPTCTSHGIRTYSCICGKTYNENIDPYGHSYDMKKSEDNLIRPVFENGAWTPGFYIFTCKNDSSHTKKEYVERADYSGYDKVLSDIEKVLEEDITAGALNALEAAVRNNKIADNLIASEQETVNIAAGNLADAYNENKDKLNVYTVNFAAHGKTLSSQKIISGKNAVPPENPPAYYDNNYHYIFKSWDSPAENITADLTVNAVYLSEAHSFNHKILKEPVCTLDGKQENICKCGFVFLSDIPAKGHTWDKGSIIKNAVPSEEGEILYTCTVCGSKKTEKIPVPDVDIMENDCFKVSGDKYITAEAGTTVERLCYFCRIGTYAVCKDGRRPEAKEAAASGLKIIFPDKKEYTVLVYGDIDSDGSVTSGDARLTLRASVKLEDFNEIQIICADRDDDRAITASDARLILRTSVGL